MRWTTSPSQDFADHPYDLHTLPRVHSITPKTMSEFPIPFVPTSSNTEPPYFSLQSLTQPAVQLTQAET